MRTKISVQDRANAFKSDKFYVSDSSILMCGICDCRLEHDKLDTLKKHILTSGHVKKKEAQAKALAAGAGPSKRQSSILGLNEKAKRAKEEKSSFISDTVKLCLKANIPLEKLDHPAVREYLKTYVRGSGDLPQANTLRSSYLETCGEEIRAEIAENFVGKQIAIVVDETSDSKGRCVLAIIFRTMTPTAEQLVQLAACSFLDKADSATVTQAIIECLLSYEIPWYRVSGLVSDSAPYMGACFRALNTIAGDHLLHYQCWAHKINLAGDIFMKELKDLNLLVTKTKMAFLNARKMKSKYLAYLAENHPDLKKKLFPSPVITRWNSWFHSVMYLEEYMAALAGFFKVYEPKNASIDAILDQFNDSAQCSKVTVQLKFVSDVCVKFITLIDVLEGSKYPYAHLLWDNLMDLSDCLKRLGDGVFPQKTISALSEVKSVVIKNELKRTVMECCQKSATKLATHMVNRQNNCTNIFYEEAGKLFNPATVGQNVERTDTSLLGSKGKLVSTFKDVDDQAFLDGYRYFQRQIVAQVREGIQVDIIQLLLSVALVHKEFAHAALVTVWATVNSVDAERFFSHYNLVLSDRRTNMTTSTVETCAMLYFNQ